MNRDIDIFLLDNLLLAWFSRYGFGEDTVDIFFNDLKKPDRTRIMEIMRSLFPSMSLDEQKSLVKLTGLGYKRNSESEHIQFVGTIPSNSGFKVRRTLPVVEDLIANARSNILITGYSMSQYSGIILDMLEKRIMCGVRVEMFINDDDTLEAKTERLRKYPDTFFKVFRYISSRNGGLSSLHAKVIAVDRSKALVSSSNLSYNGFVGNIELGVLIEGAQVGRLYDTFVKMASDGYFSEI